MNFNKKNIAVLVLVAVFLILGATVVFPKAVKAAKKGKAVKETTTAQTENVQDGKNTQKASETTEPKEEKYRNVGDFKDAPEGYFNDVLFIGDSRTEEMMEYGNITEATYFSFTGTSVYNIHKNTAKVNNGIGEVSFEDLLAKCSFKRIYIMLGVNEVDCIKEVTVRKYREIIDELLAANPDAKIIILANIHLTAEEAAKSDEVNNVGLNELNNMLFELADGKTIFYLDPNILFDDENGDLNAEYSNDGTHLIAKYTRQYAEWLRTKAIL